MKITVTRILDISKALTTDLGKQIPEFFNYMAEFVEQNIRALRNGLTFADNFDCEVKNISVLHDSPQIVSASKTVSGVLVTRVFSQTYLIDQVLWYYDDQGRLTIRIKFDSNPGQALSIAVVLLF